MQASATGREGEDAGTAGGIETGVEAVVHRYAGELVVIQSGAAQAGVVQLETKRSHQVQSRAGIGAQANDIARIGRNLRSEQDDVGHALIMRPSAGR